MENKTIVIGDLKHCVYFKSYCFRLSLEWSLEMSAYYKLENNRCAPGMTRIVP